LFGTQSYPAALIPNPQGDFTVTCRDVPEAITEGVQGLKRCDVSKTRSDSLAMYIVARAPFQPQPTPTAD